MPVVVVESPAKAKTIEKYLGKDYKVLASFGHIRDIKRKREAIDPKDNFSIDWEIENKSTQHIRAIVAALKKDPELILATDPDREGEAISWHLKEILRQKYKTLKLKSSKRISFTSITKDSIQKAMNEARDVDQHLVEAYLARCTLDFLVGYNLSPILWSKFPAGMSAGRVQSVCLRLVSERENQIDTFKPQSYWVISGEFLNSQQVAFKCVLTHFEGQKLQQFTIENAHQAAEIQHIINNKERYLVKGITSKETQITPPPPFSTATLQQDVNRKFKLSSSETMRLAQRLYEDGYITYMRTDAINMSGEARTDCRNAIATLLGKEAVVAQERVYKNKAKNTQEAHECIRTTNFLLTPQKFKQQVPSITANGYKIYELIWKRSMATQMKAAVVKNTKVTVVSEDEQVEFIATGQVPVYTGFKKLYEEGTDISRKDSDQNLEHQNKELPPLTANEQVKLKAANVQEKETKPPYRFTEATLVKEMVKHGIGRPSTYSTMISTLKKREYIQPIPRTNTLQPTTTGRLVSAFLMLFFTKYVKYDFTADMEKDLDEISGGREARLTVLNSFWDDFSTTVEGILEIERKEVNEKVADMISPYFLTTSSNGQSKRLQCPNPNGCDGKLELMIFKGSTPNFQCKKCQYYLPLEKGKTGIVRESREILTLQDTNQKVLLKNGPYGYYIEVEPEKKGKGKSKAKPKRVGIPKGINIDEMTEELCLKFLNLPRVIGKHPEDGKEIRGLLGRNGPYLKHGNNSVSFAENNPLELFTIGINRATSLLADNKSNMENSIGLHPEGGQILKRDGRFGPYVSWNGINASLPKNLDPAQLTVEDAVLLLKRKNQPRLQKNVIKELGVHPDLKGPVRVLDGRYGPYVKWGSINATIPKKLNANELTMEEAIDLIKKKKAKK